MKPVKSVMDGQEIVGVANFTKQVKGHTTTSTLKFRHGRADTITRTVHVNHTFYNDCTL